MIQKEKQTLVRIYQTVCTTLCLSLLVACSTDDEPLLPSQQPPPEEEIAQDPLAVQLDARLLDKVMGYAYLILRNGEIAHEGAGGLSRNINDGERSMTTDQPMHIASVSKWVTTITTLSILEQNDIPSSTVVAPYFPSDWTLGPGIETLTFMDLLAQRGGLNQYGSNNFNANRYDSLKQIVSNGAEELRVKLYNNNHHSLYRVILPVLTDQLNNQEGQYTPFSTGLAYEEIVKETLFAPLNIVADLQATTVDDLVFVYDNREDDEQGHGGNVDFTEVGGAYGWHISTADLADLWRAAWYTDLFMNDNTRVEMTENTAGLFETTDGVYGRYFIKDGAWAYANVPQPQLQTIAVHFPDDTDVIIFINSALDSNGWLGTVAIQAYEDSRLPG